MESILEEESVAEFDLDPVEWFRRRVNPPSGGVLSRLVAEHEAAHGIVARELGARDLVVLVDGRTEGKTLYRGVSDWGRAVVASAGIVQTQLRHAVYPGGDVSGCRADRAALRYLTDLDGQNRAARQAAAILRNPRYSDEVLSLADDLMRNGSVRMSQWRSSRYV